ncbi:MAG: SAM-dependent methyltransferase [Verrucomicrobiota bacterium]
MTDAQDELMQRLEQSAAGGAFVRLTLSRPAQAGAAVEKVLVRQVELKGKAHLSFTFREATRDVTKNLPVKEGCERIRGLLAKEFRSALLVTTAGDWQFFRSESGKARLVAHKASVKQAPPRAHDRARHEPLDESARDWLRGLGLIDAAGRVRERMADKHRQVNRYLEIITHLAREAGWEGSKAERVFADMGAGKGYLTFGLWHLFRRQWQTPVRVIGVEARAELVEAMNLLAREVRAEGLEFVAGDIQSVSLPRVDGLIALHACNTATDAAILRGIELGAKLILVAPCCHKELRPQVGHPEPLAPVLRHGIMEERLAEWLTDGLRALFLEWAGYRTKMFEFIASEHTPKNLMVSAVREGEPFTSEAARERLVRLKEFFGIQRHALDALLQRPPA